MSRKTEDMELSPGRGAIADSVTSSAVARPLGRAADAVAYSRQFVTA
jgi:hypothetical protein